MEVWRPQESKPDKAPCIFCHTFKGYELRTCFVASINAAVYWIQRLKGMQAETEIIYNSHLALVPLPLEDSKADGAPYGLTAEGGERLAGPCVSSYKKGMQRELAFGRKPQGRGLRLQGEHKGEPCPFFEIGPPLVLRFQGRIQSRRGGVSLRKKDARKTRKTASRGGEALA
jgi:hypothetical protein